jgi:hypothetical protein
MVPTIGMLLGMAVCGACGATPQTQGLARPPSPPPAIDSDRVADRPTASPAATSDRPTPSSSAGTPDQPTPSSAALSSSPRAAPFEMEPLRPSALDADLHALGLDPNHLPPIERLDPTTLRRVMKLMAKSLGIKCAGCHQEGDFAAPTRRKRIASRMWDEFVAKLVTVDGSPFFCDSCHQGRVEVLDRGDGKALEKWMNENFVAKLARRDQAVHDCETCHVDMNMHFLANWAVDAAGR